MTPAPVESPPALRPIPLVIDDRRGTGGMLLVIVSEACLFLMLFVSYWYLSNGDLRWRTQQPPKLPLAFGMLIVLGGSSLILRWGEQQLQRRLYRKARIAGVFTVLAGLVFLGMQVLEYRDHLKVLTPQTNAYGSLFYTITSVHGLHVALGLLGLIYVLLLPRLDPAEPPHRPYGNAALYWHFVDIVWIVIVALLYVVPNTR